MKQDGPCPICIEQWKKEYPVLEESDPKLSYRFICTHCLRHFDQEGNLVLVDTSDTISDSSECPGCGFHSGMVSTNKTIGKFKVFSCHQCKGLFKENKQELTDEEWAHAWINIIFRMEIAAAKDKAKKRAELVKDYRETFANPYVAAGLGYIDKVIFPHETRPLICSGLEMLASKRKSRQPKKHGNIPL